MKSGNPKTNVRLSPRDLKILKLTARFGLALFEVIHRLIFPGQHRDAVKSTLRRLCGQGPTYRYLRPEPLDGRRVVYRLTRRGAKLLGAPLHLARPMGPQARIERLAVLLFIHGKEMPQRNLISNQKLRESFNLHGHRLPRQRFFIEEKADQHHLGFVVVDHGAHYRRIVRKAVRFLSRFLRHGWFDDYIRNGQFTLTVLTVTELKERALRHELKRHLKEILGRPLAALRPPGADRWPLPVTTVVIPDLIDLIPGKNYQEQRSKL